MLLAAAEATGLLSHLEAACAALEPAASQQERARAQFPAHQPKSRCGKRSKTSRRSQVLTLLMMGVFGLQRPWDLRSYSGQALGLLAGRKRAYGYWSMERFVSSLATVQGADRATDTLARWTAQLWQDVKGDFYVDGHHKPVYSERLIPRGLIGRTGKILGCRGLMLLHDKEGHPRLVLTGRGDWHVMDGLQEIVARYEQISAEPVDRPIVVDREGMGACFLRGQAQAGRCIVTLLRSNQYQGIESFGEVGTFVPLTFDPHGLITREVAPARFTLALPEETEEVLPVQVALIRDRRTCPAHLGSAEAEAMDLPSQKPTNARLIPIITTDPGPIDAASLAASYLHRWSAQENVIKDYLLPLGLDINHGFAKTPVVNSEVAKKRELSQKHLETFKKWMTSAQAKYNQAINSQTRLVERIERDEHQYHLLYLSQCALDQNSVNYPKQYHKIQKKMDSFSSTQEKRKKRLQKLSLQILAYQQNYDHYVQKQRELLQFLEALKKNERTMYELDNRKDQVMTVFKVALANLAMWTRDQYFPDTYAHATWDRLAPFFRLPGIIRANQQMVLVDLRTFNDRQYNRDLHLLCQRVNQKQPHLPDGRLLRFSIRTTSILDGQMPLLA